MFDTRKSTLIETPQSKVGTRSNAFVSAATRATSITRTENGATTYSTSGNAFVDQFSKFSSYLKPRPYSEVAKDMETLWNINSLAAVRFAFGIRLITRETITNDGKFNGKGGELKNEGIYRMMWLGVNHPAIFKTYLPLFICIGSWKDVFTMLREDLSFHGWKERKLDWDYMGNIIVSGLRSKSQAELVKKYLPHIKSSKNQTTVRNQANTMIGKWIASLLFEKYTYKEYRKLKASGTAHSWQQLISKRQFNLIDFDKIHGKALSKLVKSKFLKNHGLSEKYSTWIQKPEVLEKGVKTTSFVHELFRDLPDINSYRLSTVRVDPNLKATINAQFDTLIKKAKAGKNEFTVDWLVVRDISRSMGSTVAGANMSAGNIAKALALYFSHMIESSRFNKHYAVFASTVGMREWKGTTPVDQWMNDTENFIGSTNLQSVIDMICQLKRQGIPESEFPTGLLLISDYEFDPTELGATNIQMMLAKLRAVGFSQSFVDRFIIVMWNMIVGRYNRASNVKFDVGANQKNVFYFSGFSGSMLQFLNNTKVKTSEDLVEEFLSQPILKLIDWKQ